MFTRQGRFKREWFDLRLDLGDGLEWVNWKDICRHHHQERGQMESYKIQTVEVTGDFGEIVDLFVRINSTGKPLTSGEKRHARFYKNAVLKEAERLVGRYRRYFVGERILSESQLSRMKGTELVSELLVSLFHGGIINKKTALDRAIGNESIDGRTLNRIVREFKATLSVIRKVLPNIRSTRFHNVADFYSLAKPWTCRQCAARRPTTSSTPSWASRLLTASPATLPMTAGCPPASPSGTRAGSGWRSGTDEHSLCPAWGANLLPDLTNMAV
jgi:hypothetical protein